MHQHAHDGEGRQINNMHPALNDAIMISFSVLVDAISERCDAVAAVRVHPILLESLVMGQP